MRGFGGIISFRLKGGKEEVSKFLKSLKIFTLAESLGGVESLAQCPAFMTHASVPAEKRAELGIMDNLIRLSLGLESTDDIIEDIEQALRWSQLKEGCGEETVVSVEECVDGKGVKGSECCQKTVTFEVQKKECCVKAECTNEECARECAKECAKECTKEFTKECTKEFTK